MGVPLVAVQESRLSQRHDRLGFAATIGSGGVSTSDGVKELRAQEDAKRTANE